MLVSLLTDNDAAASDRAVSCVKLAFGESADGRRRVALGRIGTVRGDPHPALHVSIIESRAMEIDGKSRLVVVEIAEFSFYATTDARSQGELDEGWRTYLPRDWVSANGTYDAHQLYYSLVIQGMANREGDKPADEVLRMLGPKSIRWALRQRSSPAFDWVSASRKARFQLEHNPPEITYRLAGDELDNAVKKFLEVT